MSSTMGPSSTFRFGYYEETASTVTVNCCVAMELSAPLAVTVTIVMPAATGVTVTSVPDTLTVATPVVDKDAS